MELSEKYEHILNSISTPIYVVDINDYTIIAANRASGFKDKVGKKKCYELTHHRDSPCNSPEDPCPLAMVKSTKLPATVEHIHFDIDGNKKNMLVNGYPVFDDAGELKAMIEMGLDITHRVDIELVLRESEKKFKNLFESSNDAIFVFQFRSTLQEVNQKSCELLGYSHEQMLKLLISDVFPKDEFSLLIKELKKLNEFGAVRFESKFIKSDGNRIDVDISASLLDKENGLIQGIARDISEQKRFEKEIKQSEEKYRELIDNANEAIVVAQDNMLRFANPKTKRVTGYSSEELTTMPFLDLIHPQDRMLVGGNYMKRILNEDAPNNYQFRIINKSGGTIWVEISAVLIQWQGKPATLNFLTDITIRKQAQEVLKESEEKYRSLFDNMTDSFALHEIVLDNNDAPVDYIFLEINNAFEKDTGLNREDVIGKRATEVMPGIENDPANWIEVYGKVALERIEMRFEKYSENLGKYYSILAYSPAPLQFATIFSDITEKKFMEDAIKESEEKFRAISSAAQDAIIMIDNNGNINFWNRAAEKIFGYSDIEIFGKNFHNLFVPEKFMEEHRTAFKVFQKTGTGAAIGRILEFSAIRKNGEEFPVELSLSSIKLKGVWQAVGIARDITDRKIKEDRIKLNEMRMSRLIKISQFETETIQELLDYALDYAIALTSSKIGYIYFYNEIKNEFTLNTWSKEVMKECSVMNPQTKYELSKTGLWGEAVRQRKPIIENNYHKENPYKKGYPDGHVGLNKFLTIPVFSGQNIVAVVGVANKDSDYNKDDVNQLNLMMASVWKYIERKRYEEEIKNITTTKDKFFSIIAHDLRGPMGTLMKLSALLADEFDTFDLEDRNLFLKEIKDSSENIFHLLENLLTWSRTQKGQIDFSPEKLNLQNVVEHVLKTQKLVAATKKILITSNIPEDIVINADENMLKTVIRNFIGNSIKFTPEEGFIIISHEKIDGYNKVSVTDNGIGMDEETKNRLFRIEHHQSSDGTLGEKGTGLGLILCKEFVEKHGGNVLVESEIGKGSTFSFTIPLL